MGSRTFYNTRNSKNKGTEEEILGTLSEDSEANPLVAGRNNNDTIFDRV